MHGAAQWTVFAWLIRRRHERADAVAAAHRLRRGVAAHRPSTRCNVHHDRRRRRWPGRSIDEYLAEPGPYDPRRCSDRLRRRAAVAARCATSWRSCSRHVMLDDGFGSSETGCAGAAASAGGKFASFDDADARARPGRRSSRSPAGSARRGAGRARGSHPARLLQRPREDGGDLRRASTASAGCSPATSPPCSRPTARSSCSAAGSMCINTGGEKVFPEEVEAVLHGHPAVYDAVVVGVPDERWGERVTAVVQSRRVTTSTLDGARRALPRAPRRRTRCPRTIVAVDAVQRRRSARPTTAGPRKSPARRQHDIESGGSGARAYRARTR